MYLVLDLKESEIQKIELKATILNMSLEQFVIASTKQYNEDNQNTNCSTVLCGHCKKEIPLKPYAFPFNKVIGGKDYEITLRDFPSYKCSECNTSYSDSNIQYKTDTLLENHLMDLIRNGEKIPNKMSFNDLIQL